MTRSRERTKTGIERRGTVHLVGAGPGDPELLTLRAARLIGEADALVHDRLVTPAVLDLAASGCERHDVGKRCGRHGIGQQRINALLLELAARHRTVVRLKGGDPFVFGRGGEELEALRRGGVDARVVPGITAAQGCAAALGIPLTQRGVARGVQYLTGHFMDDERFALSPTLGADPEQTLVVYMGIANAARISAHLLGVGRAATTPVAVIENGGTERQRLVRTTLETLSAALREHAVRAPALMIIGAVAALADPWRVVTTERCRPEPVAVRPTLAGSVGVPARAAATAAGASATRTSIAGTAAARAPVAEAVSAGPVVRGPLSAASRRG